MTGLFGVVHACLRFGDRVNARHAFVIRNAFGSLGRRETGKSIQVARWNVALLNVVDVVGDEAVAAVVEHEAKAAAGVVGGGGMAGALVDTVVGIADRNRRAGRWRRN